MQDAVRLWRFLQELRVVVTCATNLVTLYYHECTKNSERNIISFAVGK